MSRGLTVLLDALFSLFFLGTIGGALVPAVALVHVLAERWGDWAILGWPLAFFVVVLGVLVQAFMWHTVLPVPKPGTHDFRSGTAVVWLLRLWLQRIVQFVLWRELTMGVSTLRWMALQSLGARVSFNHQMSSDVLISEAYMMSIGEGAMLGQEVRVSGHFIVGERLIIAPVRIERGASLHVESGIAPGCVIGEGAVVGVGSRVGPNCELGAGASLGFNCILMREVRIGKGARVGASVTIGRGATVAPGAKVPDGTIIAAGVAFDASVSALDTGRQ